MDLKSFSNNDPYREHRKKEPQPYDTSTKKEEPQPTLDEGDVRKAIGHFSKMNDDQLMGELLKQVTAQKANGTTDNMKQTIERIKPFLSPEQRKRLESIIGQLNL